MSKIKDVRRSFNKKIIKKDNVFNVALNRFRRIFDEFENVVVSYSGGKDSTVTLELALIVAREKNRLPLKVMFLDQEGEWQATIDMVKEVMNRDEVDPIWLQIPFRIFNSTSFTTHWLNCWGEDKKDLWMREKDPVARKENVYETDRFGELFAKIIDYEFNGESCCYLGGVRTEESPARFRGMTSALTYRDITWGKKLDDSKGQYTFYPIYDWRYTDVWKAIHDNNWKYCSVYDSMYQYGVTVNNMRVSNLNHETAVHSLFILQEIEPETYVKMTKRLEGVDMAGKMSTDNFFCPKNLPPMFDSWIEYRDYLLIHLLDERWHEKFRVKFEKMKERFEESESVIRKQITSILCNDHEFVKLRAVKQNRKEYAKHQARKYADEILAN